MAAARRPLLPRWQLQALFSAAALLALPAAPLLFGRPLDYRDSIQTVALMALFAPLSGVFAQILARRPILARQARREPPAPADPGAPADPAATPRAGPPRPAVAPPPTMAPPLYVLRPLAEADNPLYHSLVAKAFGDRDTANRLIEYERRRHPSGSRSELIQRAIDRWERDNL
jgi:hypothetical protein